MSQTFYNSKVFFSPTFVPSGRTPTLAEFQAITDWVEAESLVSAPAFGGTDQYVNQDLISQTIQSSQKTVATAGAGNIIMAYAGDSTAQQQWDAAGKTNRNYAFKQELSDAPSPTMTNTIEYGYGLVGRQKFTEASGPGTFANLMQPVQMNEHSIIVRPTTI